MIFRVSEKKVIETDLPAFIMGIVNCTPDSFFAGSRGGFERAMQLVEEGASLLDIGGESTRPGASYTSEDEELERVIPVIERIRKESDIAISVDTRKKKVMEAAFNAGADILNDISALEDDQDMAGFAAETKIPVVLMHKRGNPSTMQRKTDYADPVLEVTDYLQERIAFAISKGIAKDRIIADPGIGFGKDLAANTALIRNTAEIREKLGVPILMALSRKTCIGEMTGRTAEDRLYGTLAADIFSVMHGAFMVRVHDVAPCLDTLRVLKSLV